jgi:glycosyltransferase involved in cell wall biosynthesis
MQNITNKLPLISVVLPVYNAELYVENAILSILNQTIQSFELILIDDGSSDNSLKIMKGLSATDNRIKLISRENMGLVYSLNQGISLAIGKWIARMDADDIAYNNRFEKQLNCLEKTDADICGSWAELFGEQTKVVITHAVTDAAIKAELLFSTPFVHPTVMFKAELAKSLLYHSDWKHCEDYDLWERVAEGGWQMANVSEILLKYRIHKNQTSTTQRNQQHQLSQSIRKRYAIYYAKNNKVNLKGLLELLKLREENIPQVNLELIEETVHSLLSNNKNNEGREVILDHITRLFYRYASRDPSVPKLWKRILKNQNIKPNNKTYLELWLINKFKLSPQSKFFTAFKNFNFAINRFR